MDGMLLMDDDGSYYDEREDIAYYSNNCIKCANYWNCPKNEIGN